MVQAYYSVPMVNTPAGLYRPIILYTPSEFRSPIISTDSKDFIQGYY